MRSREQKRKQSADRRHSHVTENEKRPFERTKHRIENAKNQEQGQRHDDQQSRFGALFTFVLSRPVQVIPARQLDLRVYFLDRLLNGAAKVAPAHTILDSDIALVAFTVDFRAAILFRNFAELGERDPFAGR